MNIREYPFTDPISGVLCWLVVPPGGKVYPDPGEPKTGIRHPDCGTLADLAVEIDAFWCPDCKMNGRVSVAWCINMIHAAREAQ